MQQVVEANQTFLVSDGEDVSTTELLRRMGQAMRPPGAFDSGEFVVCRSG